MPKRLWFLSLALLAVAACSSDNTDNGTTAPAASAVAPAASTAPATAASGPASGVSASAAPAATSAPATTATVAPSSADSTPPPAAAASKNFVDDPQWVEGKNYFLIQPQQPKVTNTDKVEVVEVFSYGCPICNMFHPLADKLASELPPGAVAVYLPASFIPQENWPMLQRAYLTAQVLGVADKAHDAIYDAVWKSGELSAENPGGGLKPASELPTLADAAKVYAKFGVKPEEFLAVANSFSINTKVKRADELVKDYGVSGTPTYVIDGKYRFDRASAGGDAKAVELGKYLAAKELAGK